MPAYNTNLLNPFATNPTNLGASLSALSGTSSNFHAVLNSLGTISGIKMAYPNKRIGVIWIDAHSDLHTPYTTPSA